MKRRDRISSNILANAPIDAIGVKIQPGTRYFALGVCGIHRMFPIDVRDYVFAPPKIRPLTARWRAQ